MWPDLDRHGDVFKVSLPHVNRAGTHIPECSGVAVAKAEKDAWQSLAKLQDGMTTLGTLSPLVGSFHFSGA